MKRLPYHPELGWTPYAFLIYLGFFLMRPVFRGAAPGEWAVTIAGLLVFLIFYYRGFWMEGRTTLVSAAGITLLGILFAPSNPGASVFFVYAAGFIAHAVRPAEALRWLALLLLIVAGLTWGLALPATFWLPALVFSVVNGGVNLHFAEASRANALLRRSQEEVERLAQAAERERIARDLHDLLGHTLSVIALKAELAGKLLARDPERAGAEIREVERISRETLREVRGVVGGYRSEGLAAELARARLALDAAGVKLEYFAAPVELDPASETVLGLALREAVTNLVRHAGARSCRIALEETAEAIRLQVSDDGRGGYAPEGIGLAAMRERVEGLGGRLERRGEGGTTLTLVLPRRFPRREAAPEAAPAPRLSSETAS